LQPKLILVTGAAGFVGRHLCRHLVERGYRVRGTVRARPPAQQAGIEHVASGDLSGDTDWSAMLKGVDAVVHAAARVHAPAERGAAIMPAYRRINVEATARLAEQCTEHGVSTFVFLSSIKASEAEQNPESPNRRPYDLTKLEAEQALSRIACYTKLRVAVLRPPLVYGPDAAANFALLARAVAKGLPLPIGSIHNRRSFIYVGNLCDAVATCLEHPDAADGTFEVSDGPPLSTPDFVRAIGRALGRPARLLPCPPAVLRVLGQALGRDAAAESLTGDLVADDNAIREQLGWRAPFTLEQGLRASLASYGRGSA
jgi:nucleoside-diphosphate-sugar epimerase